MTFWFILIRYLWKYLRAFLNMKNAHSYDFYKIYVNLALCNYLMILPVAISYCIPSLYSKLTYCNESLQRNTLIKYALALLT